MIIENGTVVRVRRQERPVIYDCFITLPEIGGLCVLSFDGDGNVLAKSKFDINEVEVWNKIIAEELMEQ